MSEYEYHKIYYMVEELYEGKRFNVITFDSYDKMNDFILDFYRICKIDNKWSYLTFKCEEIDL